MIKSVIAALSVPEHCLSFTLSVTVMTKFKFPVLCESPFKTLITLLPVTFSQLDPQLGVLVVEKGQYFDRLSFNQWLNCLSVKYLAGWHL